MASLEQIADALRKADAAGNVEDARALANAYRELRDQQQGGAPQTGAVEQFGSGLNEGLAGFLGAPVDLLASGINGGIRGANSLFGLDVGEISNPVGGSASMRGLLDPFISDVAPQSTVQRYARRGGQELGFGVPASLAYAAIPGAGAVARAGLPTFTATSAAGDVGAALAGQTAREIAPENTVADIIASLAGGVAGAGAASRLTPRLETAPTLEQVKRRAQDAWETVNASPTTLTDTATSDLTRAVRDALPTSQLAQRSYPNAFGAADDVATLRNPTIADVEEARRIIGDRVAANPQESRVGVEMRKAISDYLGGLTPNHMQGGDPESVVEALARGRDLTARVKRAEAVLNKEMRGETRAATSGTGGNQVNATRQNIRGLFDRERDPTLSGRRQGFKPAEMEQMEKIVMGTWGQNTARLVGRMSPTSGALPLAIAGLGGSSGLTASLMTGNPAYSIPAILAGAGMVGKSVAERSTQSSIDALVSTILNGSTLKKGASRKAAETGVLEQLLSEMLKDHRREGQPN